MVAIKDFQNFFFFKSYEPKLMKHLCMCEILVTSPAVYSILVMLSDSSGGPSGEAGPSLLAL